jgi:hypothetical protein
MLIARHRVRAIVPLLWFIAAFVSFLPAAVGQDFTMQPTTFTPFSVEPGGSATATLALSPLGGFNGSVDLSSCVITPVQAVSPPICQVSPPTAFPPASPTVTIATTTATPPTLYTITITGVGPTTSHVATLNLTVLAVSAEYTLTVTTAMTPGTVHAGSGATAIITVTPTNGYSGNVTLSCSAISPTATPAPSCAFTPTPVLVAGAAQTTTLTVSTVGPAPTTTAMSPSKPWYGLWLSFPGFAILVFAGGKSRRKFLGLMTLCAIAGLLLLMPACGDSSSSTTGGGNGTLTPNNTYTFTLSGIDENSLAPSNTSPTTSLIVN